MNNVISLAKARKAARPPSEFAILNLPFIGKRQRPRKGQTAECFWHNVASSGDVGRDQNLGSQYAYLALQAIKADDFAPLLGWIALDMIEAKCPAPIAVGFFQAVADVCLGYHQIPRADMHLVVPTAPRPRKARGKAVRS